MKENEIIHIGGMLTTMSIFLFVLWLLFSAHYTPLLLSFGLLSVLLVVFISVRMQLLRYDQPDVVRQILHFIPYDFWLLKEIIISNIDVIRRILDPQLPINPQLVSVKSSQSYDLTRVVYANSITLTPGTISMDVEGGYIRVHTLAESGVTGLISGDMDMRITQAEVKNHA